MDNRTCLDCGASVPTRITRGGQWKRCAECRLGLIRQPQPVPLSCRQCGSVFTGRPGVRYCSTACRLHPRHCEGCGVWFSPWNESPRQGRLRRFCTNECRHRTYASRIAAPKVEFTCEWCLRPSMGQRGQALCSTQCRNRRSTHRAEHRHTDRCDIPWKPCEGCGAIGSFFHSRRFCQECRDEKLRARYRRKNAARRGAKVKGHDFTLKEVGDRDGWRCHLCRRRVNPSIANPDPRAPTIDHLVPIAHGGIDELANVALAHRSCNCARGARGLAQLRLAV